MFLYVGYLSLHNMGYYLFTVEDPDACPCYFRMGTGLHTHSPTYFKTLDEAVEAGVSMGYTVDVSRLVKLPAKV